SIIYGGEDSRKCAIFRLGLSHEAPTLLDFFGEIYSSAAKNLDFMRVCESVVMNIGTNKVLKLEWFQDFIFVLKSLVAYQSA
ncbi:MAG: hypothetical protein E6123_10050, partial [Clostridiales bacterium]|nr:hypothetical protein [Clostridiales bacterium]